MREWPATVTDAPTPVAAAHGAPSFDAADLTTATATVSGGRLLRAGSRPIRGAAVDSRRVRPGQLFVALPGERTDGHLFLADAVRAGATALVVSRDPAPGVVDDLAALAPGGDLTILRVDDGLRALQALGAAWRDRFRPIVVGVTGSLAKTSTKEHIAETLSERLTTLRSEGNENNEIGLPLTLLRLGPEHEAAVLEMGMYVPGEIALLARLARPHVGVVTAVRGTHLSRAGSIEAIERGKGELVEALPPDGAAILNADDERVARMRARTRARTITYGFAPHADVRAEAVTSLGTGGMRFTLVLGEDRREAATSALGRHSVHNALAAAATGLALGFDADTIVLGLARAVSTPHRSMLVRAGDWLVLDDSYNAAPDSMAAALALLGELPGRRIAVLGEMLELGDAAVEAHRSVGRLAAGVVDLLVVTGEGAVPIAEGALQAGLPVERLGSAADSDEALALLLERLRPGDVVLVKASRGVRLDRLVDGLVAAAGTGARA